MENWRVVLTARGKSLTEVKIQREIFLRPLLFVIAIMPLNNILMKHTGGYKLHKSQEKIEHLMYMDDIEQFAKNEKELDILIQAVRLYNQDIGIEVTIEKYTMLIRKSGKRHRTEGIELPNERQNQNAWRRRNLKIHGNYWKQIALNMQRWK